MSYNASGDGRDSVTLHFAYFIGWGKSWPGSKTESDFQANARSRLTRHVPAGPPRASR